MQHEDGVGAELYFYISLFHQFGIFDCQPKHYHQDIWSIRYDCVIDGIWFSMIYDEDYDTVSFSVSPKNIERIPEISEHIKTLIENDGMNVHLNDNDREL